MVDVVLNPDIEIDGNSVNDSSFLVLEEMVEVVRVVEEDVRGFEENDDLSVELDSKGEEQQRFLLFLVFLSPVGEVGEMEGEGKESREHDEAIEQVGERIHPTDCVFDVDLAVTASGR